MITVLAVALTGVVPAGATAGAAATEERPLLYFHHAYGVLDRETADAIEDSAYLRELADFQVRTTTGADGQTWTGRHLMGRETYVELFGVGDLAGPDGTLGAAGLGVSAERAGDLGRAVDRLPDFGVPAPTAFQQTRDFGDGVATTSTQSALSALTNGAQAEAPTRRTDPPGTLESRTGTSPGMPSAISTQSPPLPLL